MSEFINGGRRAPSSQGGADTCAVTAPHSGAAVGVSFSEAKPARLASDLQKDKLLSHLLCGDIKLRS